MPKHTIELKKEVIKIVKVVKAINDMPNIDETISFIVKDYGKSESYSKFIKSKERKR